MYGHSCVFLKTRSSMGKCPDFSRPIFCSFCGEPEMATLENVVDFGFPSVGTPAPKNTENKQRKTNEGCWRALEFLERIHAYLPPSFSSPLSSSFSGAPCFRKHRVLKSGDDCFVTRNSCAGWKRWSSSSAFAAWARTRRRHCAASWCNSWRPRAC